jgi:hypothetical protein
MSEVGWKMSGKFDPQDIRPPASTYYRKTDIVGSRAPSAKVLMRVRKSALRASERQV